MFMHIAYLAMHMHSLPSYAYSLPSLPSLIAYLAMRMRIRLTFKNIMEQTTN